MYRNIVLFIIALNLSFCLRGQKIVDLCRSSDFSELRMRCIGPSGLGRINAIGFSDKYPNIIYAGAAGGGVWKTENGGDSWKPVFDSQPTQNIGAIAVDQNDVKSVWVGTGDGNPRNSMGIGKGIYKSEDGGNTWKCMGLEKTYNIYRVIIDPKNPEVVYVAAMGNAFAAHTERGVYKTTDGGKHWQRILYTNDRSGCAEIVINPQNPRELFASIYDHRRDPWGFKSGGNGSGLYKTLDGGKHWEKLTSKNGLPSGELGRIGIAVAASNPKTVYATFESSRDRGLYRSKDGGKNWIYLKNSFVSSRAFYYSEIYCNPKNENAVWSLTASLDISYDGGKTFSKYPVAAKYMHGDFQAFRMSAADTNFIIIGDDGWLSMSRDGGKVWTTAETLTVGQVYKVSVDNEHPYNVMGGFQDNGGWIGPAYYTTFGGEKSVLLNKAWVKVAVGDGMQVVRDGRGKIQSVTQNGHFSTNHSYFDDLVKKEIYRFNWNTPLVKCPFDSGALYIGSQYLLKSQDQGRQWKKISPDLTRNDSTKWVPAYLADNFYDTTVRKRFPHFTRGSESCEMTATIFTISPSTIQRGLIWVGTDDGEVWVTNDEGSQWMNCTKQMAGLPEGAWISHVVASPFDAAQAFVIANDYKRGNNNPYLFTTSDGGKSWTKIRGIEEIDAYLLAVCQDPVEKDLLFVGAANGLWVSIDGGEHFSHWTSGFPQVTVTDLTIQPYESDLVLSTFGRSFWILDDISPLRELAKNVSILQKPFHLFQPPNEKIIVHDKLDYFQRLTEIFNEKEIGIGLKRAKMELLNTNNRPTAFSLSCYYNQHNKTSDSVQIVIRNTASGAAPQIIKKKLKRGFNRFWLDNTETLGKHSVQNYVAVATCGTVSDSVRYSLKMR